MEEQDKLAEVAGAKAPADTANVTSAAPDAAAKSCSDAANDNGTHQEHIMEAMDLLCEHFPKAFIKEGDCKPLKIGILEDLKPRIVDIPGLSISKIRAAVRIYTSRLRYLYALREGSQRVDLDGNECGAVLAEHAAYARERFNEINSKRRPRKKPAKTGAKPNAGANKGAPANGAQANKGNPAAANGARGANRGAPGDKKRRPNDNKDAASHANNATTRHLRRFRPVKPNDLKVGNVVYVANSDKLYNRSTVAEVPQGDKVKVTGQNGISMTVPVSLIYAIVPPRRRPTNQGQNQGKSGAPRQGKPGNGGNQGRNPAHQGQGKPNAAKKPAHNAN